MARVEYISDILNEETTGILELEHDINSHISYDYEECGYRIQLNEIDFEEDGFVDITDATEGAFVACGLIHGENPADSVQVSIDQVFRGREGELSYVTIKTVKLEQGSFVPKIKNV